MVQQIESARDTNARLNKDVAALEGANLSLRNQVAQQEDFLGAARVKINACADTKKYLRGQIEEKNAEIKKLKEQLAEAQFQTKVAKKEAIIPTSSGIRKPAAEATVTEVPVAKVLAGEVPAPTAKKPYKKRTPKAGK